MLCCFFICFVRLRDDLPSLPLLSASLSLSLSLSQVSHEPSAAQTLSPPRRRARLQGGGDAGVARDGVQSRGGGPLRHLGGGRRKEPQPKDARPARESRVKGVTKN